MLKIISKGLLVVSMVYAGHAIAGTSYSTAAATNITASSAQLNGNAASTIGLSGERFEYGETTAYGELVAAQPQGVNGPVSAMVYGLKCNTTYHFRFVGDPKPPRTTTQGVDMTFTTAACPEKYESINAGPIWSNSNAQQVCPGVCSKNDGTWSGQWMTTQPGVMSVCGCWVPDPQ